MLAKSTSFNKEFSSSFLRSIKAVESDSSALPLTEFNKSASNSFFAYFFLSIYFITFMSSLFFGILPAPYIKISAFLSMQKAYNNFESILLILLVFLSGFKSCIYLNILELLEFGSSATNFSNLPKLTFL